MSSALATATPASGKSPEAFRTISEVSLALDVPQHVLRFWEARFAQVRPVKRAGGRRFYRPEDVALLRGIRSLLYSDGYTIKGVQKVLRDKGWRYVADIGRKANGLVPWDQIDNAHDDAGEGYANGHNGEAADEGFVARENVATPAVLEERKRVRLELLLAELLVLRDHLRSARPKTRDA